MPLAVELEFKGTDRFQVQRRLGEGAMGVVYQAYDNERRTTVALKTLRYLEAQHIYRLKHEFRALADLGHRNLVQLGELICENGQWFFTMDLIDGVDFLTYVRSGPRNGLGHVPSLDFGDDLAVAGTAPEWKGSCQPGIVDEQRLRSSLGQLVLGVSALHAANKVHRDIKPSNVLVTPEGRTVLLDFGFVTDAFASPEHESTEAHVVGTALYMAPEQAASKQVGPGADWYSVGAMLYEALTGQPPFLGSWMEVILEKQHAEAPPPRVICPGVPADLDALCVDLLKINPRARPSGEQLMLRLGLKNPAGAVRVAQGTLSSSMTQAPPFVGRKRELEELRRALADSRNGQAVTLFVHGESGLGKSSLIRRFLEGLKGEGMSPVILSGRCYERESVPFKAFDGIVDSLSRFLSRLDQVEAALLLGRDASLLGRVFPVLQRVPAMAHVTPPRRKAQGPQELRTRAFKALREVLSHVASRHPLVLVIDDFQWADADSLDLLDEVMHPPDAPALCLLATLRTDTTASDSATLPRLLSDVASHLGDVRHIELKNLSQAETRELVSLLLPSHGAVIGDGIDTITDDAGGHPLFVQEIVRHVGMKGVHAAGAVRLDEVLWDRIVSLDEPARKALDAIAVAGAPVAQDVIARASGLETAECGRWISLLRVANLVRTSGLRGAISVEAYHDRVRESVLAHLDEDERRRHHGKLAMALEASSETSQDPLVLVRHLEASGATEKAARHAERAARVSSEKLAFDQAAKLYQMALRLGQYSDEEKHRLHLQVGEALMNAGRGAAAAEAYLLAAQGGDAATRRMCQRRAAEQLLMSGHIEKGLVSLSAVLADIGVSLPATPRRAVLSLVWQRAKLRMRGLRWRQCAERECESEELDRFEVYKAVAHGLGVVDSIRAADFQCRSLLLALRLGEPQRLARAISLEAIHLCLQGGKSLTRARKLLEESRRIAESTGDPYLMAFATTGDGIVSYSESRFQVAAKVIGEAENMMRDWTTGTVWELSTIRLFRLWSLRHMGAFVELRRGLDEYLRDAVRRGDHYTETTLTRTCLLAWLAEDAPAEAREELENTSWSNPERGYHIQHWYELRARVELDLYLGQVGGAVKRWDAGFTRLGRSMLTRIQIIRAEANWLRGRLALADSAPSVSSREVLAEASRMAWKLEREKAGYATTWSKLLRAAVALQEGEMGAAQAHLRDAIDLAKQNEMRVIHLVAQRRLGEILGEEGSGLVSRADAWMAKEGVRNPARMSECLAPGLGTATRTGRLGGRAGRRTDTGNGSAP